ncbi:MAG TPA: hypothetical protein PK460_00860 [Bacilli bacterium]|nr:hypothetical protein [Bacilli bacterium]HOQ70324.1 hypothetical protein [Bacilli bacterium]HPK28484.1 hypothetical protein [Bacilli bacterium]
MKKEDLLSILVYLVMLIIALFIGLRIIQPALDALDLVTDLQRYGFAILTILVGIIINVILFELGHVFGALLGGYSVISVNILGLAYYKTKSGWKFSFRRYEGLTGETKIIAKSDKTKPRLYLFGPTIMVLLEFVVAIVIFLLTKYNQPIHHQVLIVAGIGAMLLVYNIMPFKLDNFTDGYYIVLLGKKVNVEAYNELIRIESLVYNNEKVTDIKEFDEVTTMTARLSLYRLYQLIDEKAWDKALSLIDDLEKNASKVEHEFIARIRAQKLYIYLLTKASEAASAYWFDELSAADRKFISNDLTIETMRVYLLYSGLVTKSQSECAFVLSRAPKALRARINDFRKEEEIALFNEAYEKIVALPGNENLKLPVLK